MTEAVRIERQGAVATVILERPEARNAVDPATAGTARGRLPRDRARRRAPGVGALGAGGTFLRGSDLKAVASRLDAHQPAPPNRPALQTMHVGLMGPTRLQLEKPVIRRDLRAMPWRADSNSPI